MWVTFLVVVLALNVVFGVALVLSVPLMRRLGQTSIFDLPTRKKQVLLGYHVFMTVVTSFALAEIVDGTPAVGIAVLVGAFVLPSMVTTPLTVRRAKRRAEQSRARRGQE